MNPRYLDAAECPAPPPSMGRLVPQNSAEVPLPDLLSLPCQHIVVTLCLCLIFTVAHQGGAGTGSWRGVALNS